MTIGADAYPIISYTDNTNADLKVAKCNDPACTAANETITTLDATGAVGFDTSITVGADGNPIISYSDNTNGDLKVLKCNDPACTGANETITTVDATGAVGYYTSITIGADSNPIISYLDFSNLDLKVVKCNDPACTGSDETITTLDTTGFVGFYTSITIGADGNPVMSYYDNTLGDLKVAKCNDPACTGANETITAVDTTGDVGYYTSLTIGADANPIISYMDSTNGDLKVAKCNDPACTGANETITTVDATGSTGAYTSITIGADANPIISYYDVGTSDLKVAMCNDPACTGTNETITTVDATGDVGRDTSITIGANANPIISYHDFTNGVVKIATLAHTSWVPNNWGR